jgi:hypothetical protein
MVTGPLDRNTLRLLDRAIAYWEGHGFAFVDLPWVVETPYSDATRPAYCRDIATPCGSFVASGEQSFLQLHDQGLLRKGFPGYVGWSPCLRDEAVLDELHQHGFMKAEWYVPLVNDGVGKALGELIRRQRELFIDLANIDGTNEVDISIVRTGEYQLDIELAGVEIGSYGRRTFKGRQYLYGTALALPRFNIALQRLRGLSFHSARQASLEMNF